MKDLLKLHYDWVRKFSILQINKTWYFVEKQYRRKVFFNKLIMLWKWFEHVEVILYRTSSSFECKKEKLLFSDTGKEKTV